jgi:Tfp pilus assembly protein PilF
MMNESYTIRFLIEHKKFDEAQKRIGQALSEDPSNADLHSLQAELHFHKEQHKKARRSVDEAISLDPEHDYYYYLKAQILHNSHELKLAMENIDEALRLDPDYAHYYGLKALIYLSQGWPKEAEEYARKGLALEADQAFCRNVLSMVLNRSGRASESQEVLEDLLAENPEDEFAHANMGYAYLRKGKSKQAKEHFKEALLLDPNDEYSRAGMSEAIKSTNVFYRKTLQFSYWLGALDSGVRWVFIIGLLIISRIIPFLAPFYAIFVFWVWFAGPVSDVILLFDRYGRYLMNGITLTITRVNLSLIILSLLSIGLALYVNQGFWLLAAGSFVAIVPVYRIPMSRKRVSQYIQGTLGAVFLALGVMSVLVDLGGDKTLPFLMPLIIVTVAYTWLAGALE